ncbi:cytochrome P450 2E1-like [Dendronephthya gigantea]|uniref:cytochrome P450 2E1-like n=1 Tax=Dendronephthya gigantea TaxID=151771 RepID=UPI00106D331C|nr:cytochrome P450 2E1-like [Dendronephthya gigantea]
MFIEVAVSAFLIWVVWYISNTWIKKRGMPPGPFPLPWIGNIPQVMSNQQFLFENLSNEYGDIFTAFLPNGTFVVINTASLARQARLSARNDFAGRSSESSYPLELIFEKDVGFSDYSPGYLFRKKIERAKEIKKLLFLPEFFAHRETYTPGVTRDLTDSFIAAYEKEIAKETGKDIGSIEDIPNLMLDFASGGFDTTAATICWFLLHVVLRQEIQAKLHKEIDSVVKNDRLPCWQDAQNMPFLQATLCEVMRTSGPVPATATTAIRDTNVAGYHVPKNTILFLNINQIHYDIREWTEPNEFKPERFLDEEGKFVGWTARHAFMPFGLGRRECLGQQLAKVTMFVFASTLLHHYKFELPEGAEKPDVLPTGLQVHRPKDFTLVAKKRH